MKVYLFGSMTVGAIPKSVEEHIEKILEQTKGEVEFIVGDSSGADTAYHATLSRIGGRSKTKIYCADYARNNTWELPIEVFDSEGLIGVEMYEARDREMINDCDFAICVWDGEAKGSTFKNINILKVNNKPVYVYTLKY